MKRLVSYVVIMLLLASIMIGPIPGTSQTSSKEIVHHVLGMEPVRALTTKILGEKAIEEAAQQYLADLEQYRTPKNFNLHTVETLVISLRVLEQTIPHERQLAGLVKSTQRSDGGFSESPQFNNSFYGAALPALISLGMLGEEPNNMSGLRSYLMHWKEFAYRDPEIAIVPLFYIGHQFTQDEIERISDKLASLQRSDGGYARFDEDQSSASDTFDIVTALFLLGKGPRDYPAAVRYVRDCQTDNGGFAEHPGDPRSNSWSTYASVMTLQILKSSPESPSGALQYLKERFSSGEYIWYPAIGAIRALATMSALQTTSLEWHEILLLSSLAAVSVILGYCVKGRGKKLETRTSSPAEMSDTPKQRGQR